jgi:HNH endonuclease
VEVGLERCQVCGSFSNLEVHHKKFRSQSGEDSEENLISVRRNAMPGFTAGQERNDPKLTLVCFVTRVLRLTRF